MSNKFQHIEQLWRCSVVFNPVVVRPSVSQRPHSRSALCQCCWTSDNVNNFLRHFCVTTKQVLKIPTQLNIKCIVVVCTVSARGASHRDIVFRIATNAISMTSRALYSVWCKASAQNSHVLDFFVNSLFIVFMPCHSLLALPREQHNDNQKWNNRDQIYKKTNENGILKRRHEHVIKIVFIIATPKNDKKYTRKVKRNVAKSIEKSVRATRGQWRWQTTAPSAAPYAPN